MKRSAVAILGALLAAWGCGEGGDPVAPAPPGPSFSHEELSPEVGENLVWHGQIPDLVGTDIEFQERQGRLLAFVASMGVGFKVVDITDPAHPLVIGVWDSPGWQNDIQVQGGLAILSNDLPPDPNFPTCLDCGTFEGIELVSVANPTLPLRITDLATDGGAHNTTLIGTTAYISNPSRDAMDVVDVSDPAEPRVLVRYASEGSCEGSPYECRVIAPGERDFDPHDITALTMPDKGHRLYVAAVRATFILDANDPFKVRVVSKIPNGDPAAGYDNIEISHQSDPSPDGRLLVVSDERGGGLDVGCPGGGLHVYDITAEANPKKLGVYFANTSAVTDGNCTVHNFRFLPDRSVLVTGWYTGGTWVVDMSGPSGDEEFDNSDVNPGQRTTWGRTLGFAIMPGADTWASKSPGLTADGRMFIYTNDMVRGMDVFEYTGSLPPPSKKTGRGG